VLVANTRRLPAPGRAKTDRLDARMLALGQQPQCAAFQRQTETRTRGGFRCVGRGGVHGAAAGERSCFWPLGRVGIVAHHSNLPAAVP